MSLVNWTADAGDLGLEFTKFSGIMHGFAVLMANKLRGFAYRCPWFWVESKVL